MTAAGYMPYYTPPKPPKLAQAAASKDPYGLATQAGQRAGQLALGAASGFAAPAPAAKTPGYTQQQVNASLAANPYASHGGYEGIVPLVVQPPSGPPTAAGVNNYDLNADPALQQIQALVGQSNDQAQSSALKQRQNLLLAYGDPTVAASILGPGDPIAAAAGQNPTSTVKQLGQSRDRNLQTLDEQLNAANLGYSGYRVTQEQQAGQDYQNALAQAAGGLNSSLDQVGSNLAAALAGNNQQVVSGINSAADRAAQAAATSGADPGALAAAAGGGSSTPPVAPPTQYSGLSPNAGGSLASGAGQLAGAGAARSLQGVGGQGYGGGVDSAPVDAAARLRKLLQLPG